MKEKFIALLTFTSSLRNFGTKFIRVAILVVFVWIGGLKYFHYETDGIVPFVANSPFMSFFYAKEAPEYKNFKNPEGALVPENRAWHEANNTYTFSYGLGALIMSIGILVFLGIFFPKVGLVNPRVAASFRVKEQMESRMAAAESTRRCRATPILRHGFRLLHRLPLRRRSAASEQTCKSSPEAPGCRLES